ncbi:MAG: ribose-phosphate pyrophosphokinase [Caldiserica bacterium]|nr:ribose-phosphate pyrophosphokinase [Caldisericota bacterium]
MNKDKDGIKIFTGNAHRELAEEISRYVDIPLGDAFVGTFSDGETQVKINESVRGKDIFLIQPTCPPVNHNLMELLILLDAFRRASARKITAVIPYYGYARQDRKVQPRVPISSKLVANLITQAGADRVLVMDLHAGQIQGFFDIPVDHLYAAPLLVDYIKKKNLSDLTIVAPDPGGVERARAFAKRLEASLAIVDKRRPEPNVSQVMHIVGEIKDRNVFIIDDMIDTGGTIIQAAQTIKEKGARAVYCCATHPVFSGRAVENLENSVFEEVVVTNSIPKKEQEYKKITVLSVASLLGEAILRVYKGASISSLFI